MEVGSFENSNVLMNKFYRLAPRRFSTRMHETAETLSTALDLVQRPRSEVHDGLLGASVFWKRKCVEGGEGYPVRDGVSFSLQKSPKKLTER